MYRSRRISFETVLHLTLGAGLVAIAMSDTLGGFCFRAALVMPLVWTGLVGIEAATSFATLGR